MTAKVLYNNGKIVSTTNPSRSYGYARQEILFDGTGADVVSLVVPFDAKFGIGGIRIQNLTNSAMRIDSTLENFENDTSLSNTTALSDKNVWSQINASLAAGALDAVFMPPMTGFKFTPVAPPGGVVSGKIVVLGT